MRRMKHIRVIVSLAVVAVILVAAWLTVRGSSEETSPYRFATVERGDLEAIVSATGKLSAVTTVQVGTQVSGQIAAINVDFNDRVKQGQLIARIDPTLQQQAVRDAQAGLERNRAELEKAQRDYDRSAQLFERKVLTEIEFNDARYALAVARANVKSADVTLERARQNLEYTSIFAPIDGIVVERNVNVGQTVAASLNTPQLFLIANDLSRMQILASVDESDIGMIREKQPVRFSVQAYPNDSFTGAVQQVRLQSTTQENVVNYTVVVEVENPDGRLLPGMTATVEFIAGSASDALLVPNAALRFRPTEAMWAEVRARMGPNQGRPQQAGNGQRNGQANSQANGQANRDSNSARGRRANAAMLWYLDSDGRLAIARVRTGITDGQRTQVESQQVRDGMQIIVGAAPSATPAGNNPFQSPNAQRGGGPRPPGTF
jgi:HlyD family secretion protein